MTIALAAKDVAAEIEKNLPGSVVDSTQNYILVKPENLPAVAGYLKNTDSLYFDYLNFIAAVDYFEYFEVVYQTTSTRHNHTLMLKTRSYDRANPTVPSVIGLWEGANFQEREAYDLMGVYFEGHPNMKRIFLWEGFQGHPLRKDYL